MAIKINFDVTHNPESPTFILAKRNGDKLGQIKAKEIEILDSLNNASEVSFRVYKYLDNELCHLWNDITDFKLVHCPEWDMWFEISVSINEDTETIKTITCTQLGQAELSQIMLYTIEINTENDIAREEYNAELPTVLYREREIDDKDEDYEEKKKASLLHRIMEKAPHYTVLHVDDTIKNIQRTFTFDSVSILDAYNTIAEEIHCIFILNSNSDRNGNIQRTVSVYDLESNCSSCGYRGEFTAVCPECGSTKIDEGYGNDTNIFITYDKLSDSGIELTTDTASMKNCFKLEAGDELMTATVRNSNPNGTDYIWRVSDDNKSEMSEELSKELDLYNEKYQYYQEEYIANIDKSIINKYNSLVGTYQVYNEDLESVQTSIKGYPSLMNAYYNTVDLELYLKSGLMPTVSMSDTNAEEQASKLTTENLSPVATTSIKTLSLATANNIVLAMAKVVADSRYKVSIPEGKSTLVDKENYKIWHGNFTVTNYSDEEDAAISDTISIIINDDYEKFVKQKIERALKKDDTDTLDITSLFKKSDDDFVNELKKYSLACLKTFYDSCQACIDILIEQGIADNETWSANDPNLYDDLYKPYLNKLTAIQSEIKIRENEIESITGLYDKDGNLINYGFQNYINEEKNIIQSELDFESYLGEDLWLEFCTFRREDKYSNSNYISDGLNNSELFKKAFEFIQVANKEIYKASELKHSITTTLKNLLVIKDFEPLVNDFQIGNWIRVQVDDEVYKLRLISYTINYDNISNISVEFSDVAKLNNSINNIQGVLSQASSMATSYEAVQRQVQQGQKSNAIVNDWVSNGLDATNTKIVGGSDNQSQTWDEHGMLFRKYDSDTNTYEPEQLKIINSTMAITDDNWETTKTAIGMYYYFHPETGELTKAYGVNAETIIGKLIIGENLNINNTSGSLLFNENGFNITNGTNSFVVNPNSEILVSILNKDENGEDKNVFYIDNNGTLHLTGDGTNVNVSQNVDITDIKAKLTLNSEAVNEVNTKLDACVSKEYLEDYVDEEILALSDEINTKLETYATKKYVSESIADALSNIGVAEQAVGY